MSGILTIELPETTAREIERVARAAGKTPEAFVAEAATLAAQSLAESQAFFDQRGRGGDLAFLRHLLRRDGGEQPRLGDEALNTEK